MKVLVAGANGNTGRLLIKQLAEQDNLEAVAMIREEDQAAHLKELGATEIVVADLEEDLTEAVKGMEVVIFAAGSGSKTGPDKTISVDQEGAKRLVDAAKANHVKQFVILSSMGADRPNGSIKHYHEAKGEADAYLRKSGVAYTIVRPGHLSHDEGTGQVELSEHIDSGEGRAIPREDVARVMVASIDRPSARNQSFDLLEGSTPIEEALEKLAGK